MSVAQITHRRVFNAYLVTEDDGLTLVDTGPASALGAVRAALLTEAGPLRRVVLTHAHGDHVAGVDVLLAEHPDLEIILGAREAPLWAGDFSLRDGEPGAPPKARSYGSPTAQPTRLVTDGERVGSLRVIDTPGHTPGHVSLLDERDGTLIAGDALTTIGRPAVSGDLVRRWPFPAFSTWNKEVALQSARRLLDAEPRRLATGHGPVLDDATRVIETAIAAS